MSPVKIYSKNETRKDKSVKSRSIRSSWTDIKSKDSEETGLATKQNYQHKET